MKIVETRHVTCEHDPKKSQEKFLLLSEANLVLLTGLFGARANACTYASCRQTCMYRYWYTQMLNLDQNLLTSDHIKMLVRACADAWETVLDLVKIFSSPPVLVNSLHFFVVWRLYILCTIGKNSLETFSVCTLFLKIKVPIGQFRKTFGGRWVCIYVCV